MLSVLKIMDYSNILTVQSYIESLRIMRGRNIEKNYGRQ